MTKKPPLDLTEEERKLFATLTISCTSQLRFALKAEQTPQGKACVRRKLFVANSLRKKVLTASKKTLDIV